MVHNLMKEQRRRKIKSGSLAKHLGISQASYSHKRLNSTFKQVEIDKLLDVFSDCSYEYLFRGMD